MVMVYKHVMYTLKSGLTTHPGDWEEEEGSEGSQRSQKAPLCLHAVVAGESADDKEEVPRIFLGGARQESGRDVECND